MQRHALCGLLLVLWLTVVSAQADGGEKKSKGLSSRDAMQRRELLERYGGNMQSESAVTDALKWLVAHQLPDGGWSFDHHQADACKGKCSHPGSLDSGRNAATAMALLPLLGAGYTNQQGEYKKHVAAGLAYLLRSAKEEKSGASFRETGGSMYSHGLCSIALCEAYAMNRDKKLMKPAQMALYYIANAQDPVGGGWRYAPLQPGDTSVTGWQLAALKTGHTARLLALPKTVSKINKFFDSVQTNDGANYGYTTPGAGQATTAIGLLSRIQLGWKRDREALVKGVAFLDARGPSFQGIGADTSANMYYNYYATQVMFHYGGKPWKKWNATVRDKLIDAQTLEGHAAGSWHFLRGDHGTERGGRLYCTSLSAMVLEVYYRHPRALKEAK